MKKLFLLILFVFLFVVSSFADTAKQVDFLLAGYRTPTTDVVLSGGKVYTYLDGTSTLSALWTDKDKGGSATNPVILDSTGKAEIYGDNIYKFEIYDSDDVLIETINGLEYFTSENSLSSGLDVDHDTDFTHIVFENFADLRASTLTPFDGQIIELSGSESEGDGGGGPFFWSPASVVTDDDLATLKIDIITTGRFIRVNSEDVKNIYSGDHSLPNAVDYVSDGSAVRVDGIYDVGDDGVISTDKALKIFGMQSGEDEGRDPVGDQIINTGVDTIDSPVITFDGSTSGDFIERAKIEDLTILHHGTTSYAVTHTDSIHNWMHNVSIDMGDDSNTPTGFGGVQLVESGYFANINKTRIKNFTDVGVYISGVGSEHNLIDNHIATGGTGAEGAIAVLTEQPGTNIVRGEYASSASGGICIKFLNTSISERVGGNVTSGFFELIPADGWGIIIDGTTQAFSSIAINDLRVDLVSNLGVCVLFERARYCKVINPQVSRATHISDPRGTLVEWGENSVQCELICDYIGATAAITVHASATRATKTVTGMIQRALVTNITTDANLTTILQDGVDDLPPGFVPIHNGTAWNYHMVNIANDDVYSFTPPSGSGIIKIINANVSSLNGHVSYNNVNLSSELIGAGTNIEVSTLVLNPGDGTNGKVTVSAANDGDIYISNRLTSNNFTILLESSQF